MLADPAEKIRALAEIEALAYEEMRQFLVRVCGWMTYSALQYQAGRLPTLWW
jgi:hypothetical protein